MLETGYRVPRQILDYASRLLAEIAPGLAPARSLRQDPGSLAIVEATAGSLPGDLARVCAAAVSGPGSAAVIVADEQAAAVSRLLRQAGLAHDAADGAGGSGLTLVPVTLAKGLEFDEVIVVESRGPGIEIFGHILLLGRHVPPEHRRSGEAFNRKTAECIAAAQWRRKV